MDHNYDGNLPVSCALDAVAQDGNLLQAGIILRVGTSQFDVGIGMHAGSIKNAVIVAPFLTPANSSDVGYAGSIKWDTNFIYICTATNTWKRAALSTF